MAGKKIIKELGRFKKELSRTITISKMIFFGSRAWGKPHRESDVDLMVISPDFYKKRSLSRGVDFYLQWNLNYPVDFLCYTPKEFERKKKQIGIVRQVAEEGIEI